ncbi:Mitochondrial pyruvate carrier 4 [Bienertia sinuspersici]
MFTFGLQLSNGESVLPILLTSLNPRETIIPSANRYVSMADKSTVTATGVIWSRYSTVITPKNWNLFSVNVAMAGTGIYQLTRKIKHDYFQEQEPIAAKE